MSFSIAIGPRIRKSPFFDKTVTAGVSHFSTYNHMYMPVSYGDPLAEYDRVVNHVDIRDVAVQRQVRLKGRDAMRLAQLLTPRNLEHLQIGKGVYMPICNNKGTLVNDPVLLRISDDELWLSIADNDTLMMAEGFVRLVWMLMRQNLMFRHWPYRGQNPIMSRVICLVMRHYD